ncbi:MAG: FtsX-like permease family protein [Pirellulaceae bacterium]
MDASEQSNTTRPENRPAIWSGSAMWMLDRKLLRDLLHISTQAIAIALVMAAGVAMFNMSLCALESLSSSRAEYYRKYRFADVFSSAKRVPKTMVSRIEAIPGVSSIAPRIVSGVSLDVAGMNEPAAGLFISLPDFHRPALNDVYLISGRMVDPDQPDEVLASKSFVEAHNLKSGDHFLAIINGKRQRLQIVGVALSPEYVIQIRPGSLLPDHKRFGVFWMCERQMAAAFDMEGAFNDVSLGLERGANEDDVIAQLDELLEPYGSVGAYGRDRQTSHSYISDEIRQLTAMAWVAPTIFLAVAAFLLNVVIARIIGLQREQIAALKAFGYSNVAVGWHYLKMVFVIASVGAVLGVIFGYLLGINLTRMYAEMYQFPYFRVRLSPLVVVSSIFISLAASAFGAVNSVLKAVQLPPAEAMRPEPPAKFRPSFVERAGIGRILPQMVRMLIRQLERKPIKAITAIIGIGMAVAILMLGSFSLDAIRFIMNVQFRVAQRQQVMVALIEASEPQVVHAFRHQPGVTAVQPFRAVATRIEHGHRSRRIGVMGLAPQPDLFRLLDTHQQQINLPSHGLVINDKLADLLELKKGDTATVHVLEGKRPIVELVVSDVVSEYGGLNAYMHIDEINRLTHEGKTYSGAFLAVDHDQLDALYAQLKETPRVASVTIKDAALKGFEDTIAENILTMRTFNILFSVIIAFGVVYNSARISLSEQSRDLATMRVMGFTQGEVATILLGELAILTLLAIPVGWVIGYGLAALFVMGLDTEIYRIPLVIDRSTYVAAAIVVMVAAFLSALIVQRQIRKLDLIGVLKTKE